MFVQKGSQKTTIASQPEATDLFDEQTNMAMQYIDVAAEALGVPAYILPET